MRELTPVQLASLRLIAASPGITPAVLGRKLIDAGAVVTVRRDVSAKGAALIAGKHSHALLKKGLISPGAFCRGLTITAQGSARLETMDARPAPSQDLRADKPIITVPALFWLDHADRAPYDAGQVGPVPIHVTRTRVSFHADDPGLELLMADARFYADPDSMDACPRSIRESARRTVSALERFQEKENGR